jgi:predicted nucleic acid-binding protein
MIVHLDTSVMVEALRPDGKWRQRLRALVQSGDWPTMSAIVLYEWLRGPRTEEELQLRQAVLPDSRVVGFGVDEAARASRIYRMLARHRSREADIAVAACAIEHGAALWTLNRGDFQDIPDLQLYSP